MTGVAGSGLPLASRTAARTHVLTIGWKVSIATAERYQRRRRADVAMVEFLLGYRGSCPCLRIDDRREREELRDYVNKLIDRGRHVNPAKAGTVGERPALSGTSPPGRAGRRPASARSKAVKATGHCIRCGKDIPLNAEKPLCLTDYKQWEKREKRDYPEKHCHRCGKEYSTTFAKPLCLPCYRESPSATP